MDADRELSPLEARVLGVLVEKEFTTPEQYPLSLNALVAGCNQKSNRDPVMEVSESEVHQITGKMIVKGWIGAVQPIGSRVEKFRHNAAALLEVGRPHLAILAELLMRGPQQPGELRQRASRMAELPTLEALSSALATLLEKGLVVRRAPQPGSRAETYAQTLAPAVNPPESRVVVAPTAIAHPPPPAPIPLTAPSASAGDSAVEKRVADLELEVTKLRRQLANLAWKLGEKLDP